MTLDCIVLVAPRSGAGQDRATVIDLADGKLIVVADGAGGTGGGAAAADAVVDHFRTLASTRAVHDARDLVLELTALDAGLKRVGQTTAVAIVIRSGSLFGASVGDSGAWLVHGDRFDDLTGNQIRKPLLGAEEARPVGFEAIFAEGTLVVGTDGLFKYARIAAIGDIARGADLGPFFQS